MGVKLSHIHRELINCTNARILRNFGSYVNKAFKLRNECLYR